VGANPEGSCVKEIFPAAAKPCLACPWRVDRDATHIPNFQLCLAEKLAATCPDENGHGPDFFQSIFACHDSKPGREFACAGWLATVGMNHPQVRLAVAQGRLSFDKTAPKEGWPVLHTNCQDVLAKLRATAPDVGNCDGD
jgi:hypothetical protein